MPTGFAVSGLFDNQVIVQREYPLARAAPQGGVLEFDAWGQDRGSLAFGPNDFLWRFFSHEPFFLDPAQFRQDFSPAGESFNRPAGRAAGHIHDDGALVFGLIFQGHD